MTMIDNFWVFHCAYMRTPRRAIISGGGLKPVRVPFLCGLAEHRELGPILFDAPYCHEGPANVGNLLGGVMQLTGLCFKEKWSVVPRIEELGFRAADVQHVFVTHLHYDHTGGLKTLAHSQIHVSQREWDDAHDGSNRRAGLRGYIRDDFTALRPRFRFHEDPPLIGEDAEGLDVLDDGSVKLFHLPGHTHGHCGYEISLADGRTIFFAGDAAFTVPQLFGDEEPGVFPKSVAASVDDVYSTLEAFRQYHAVKKPDLVITSHDLSLGRKTISSGPIQF